MDNRLEKRMLQADINQTPKTILEELFTYIDEKRCHYEEQEFDYWKKIRETQNIIMNLQDSIKNNENLTVKEIKGFNEYIKEQKTDIEKNKREIRLIKINCSILWKNELKMDKVLEYGLED